MTQQAHTDISDIKANHRKDIFFTELKNFKTSLHHIEHETSTVYSDLCTWKASQTRLPAGASEEHAAAMETKQTTLTQNPEPDQDGDIKGITKGEEIATLANQEKSRTRTTSDRSIYLEPALSVEKPSTRSTQPPWNLRKPPR